MYVVYDTLRQMGAEGKPVITLFNKQDRLEKEESHKDFQADYSIATSAKTGQGLDELKVALLEIIRRDQIYVERLYPFADASFCQKSICRKGFRSKRMFRRMFTGNFK